MLWKLLGVLINKVQIKNFKFILHSLYFLEIAQNHPRMFAVFEYQVVFINKSAYKKLKQQELNASIRFRDYKTQQKKGL